MDTWILSMGPGMVFQTPELGSYALTSTPNENHNHPREQGEWPQQGCRCGGTESRAHTKRQDSEENKDDFTSAKFVFGGKETMTMWIRHTLSPSGRV